MPRPLLLLMGDSLTEYGSDCQNGGWICLLLNRFHLAADIAQRGMGGYSTQWYMDYVAQTLGDDLATTLHPRFVTLWLGANDAALPDGPCGDQNVPIDKYKANLHAMISLLQDKTPDAEILLITPPPVDDAVRRQLFQGELDRSNAAALEYARACVEVAMIAQVQVLDLYTQFTTLRPGGQWKALLVDGLHLSKKGNQLMEELLTDMVKTKFSALERELQFPEYPLWHRTQERSEKMPLAAIRTDQHKTVRRVTAIETSSPQYRHAGDDKWGSGSLLSALLVVGLFVGFVIRRVVRRRTQPQAEETHDDACLLTA